MGTPMNSDDEGDPGGGKAITWGQLPVTRKQEQGKRRKKIEKRKKKKGKRKRKMEKGNRME